MVRVPFKITTDTYLPPGTRMVPEHPHPARMAMLFPLASVLCLERPWQALPLNPSGLGCQAVFVLLSFQRALSPASACLRCGRHTRPLPYTHTKS